MNANQVPSPFLTCGAGRPSPTQSAMRDACIAENGDTAERRPPSPLLAMQDPDPIAICGGVDDRPAVITTLFPAMLEYPAGISIPSEP